MNQDANPAVAGQVERRVMHQAINDPALVRELQCYERMWQDATTKENKEAKWQAIVAATECLPAHPEGYEGPCFCARCLPDWADA
jgi:hypothetical protein